MPDDVRVDHLSIKAGDDRPLAWELLEVDGDALSAGTFSACAQVRARPGGPLLHEWSTEGDRPRARFVSRPGATDDAPLRWWVELLCDDSREWTWERGLYDLYISHADEDQPIAEGRVVVRPTITDG